MSRRSTARGLAQRSAQQVHEQRGVAPDALRAGRDALLEAQVVVLPRTPEQRAELAAAGGYVVPERAIDAQSLIAYADAVVSAGGTMNREAVALGTPVWTTFEGRLGAVDERLIAEGRLRRLERADDVEVVKRDGGPAGERVRRDPAAFTDLLVDGLARGS